MLLLVPVVQQEPEKLVPKELRMVAPAWRAILDPCFELEESERISMAALHVNCYTALQALGAPLSSSPPPHPRPLFQTSPSPFPFCFPCTIYS